MLDINGRELKQGDLATLLCEIIGIEPAGVVVRILNSELYPFLVQATHDEVLGGLVAGSELAKFDAPNEPNEHNAPNVPPVSHEDDLRAWPME